jgi:hypothetical protein
MGADLDDDVFVKAREVLASHPGAAPVEVRLGGGNGIGAPLFRSRTLNVDPNLDAMGALQEIFGKARVRLVRAAGVPAATEKNVY